MFLQSSFRYGKVRQRQKDKKKKKGSKKNLEPCSFGKFFN